MSGYPKNPYLEQFFRSEEGDAYMRKHGCLELCRQKYSLDIGGPVPITIVADPDMPEGTLFFDTPGQPGLTITNIKTPDPWEF